MPIISFTVSIWIYPTLTTPCCCIHASRIYLLAWPFRMVYKMHRLHYGMCLSFPILQAKPKIQFQPGSRKVSHTICLNTYAHSVDDQYHSWCAAYIFWTLTILFFYHAIFEDKTIYWLLGGMAMGLTFDSKYSAHAARRTDLVFIAVSEIQTISHFL